jgi:hypothetical protein
VRLIWAVSPDFFYKKKKQQIRAFSFAKKY